MYICRYPPYIHSQASHQLFVSFLLLRFIFVKEGPMNIVTQQLPDSQGCRSLSLIRNTCNLSKTSTSTQHHTLVHAGVKPGVDLELEPQQSFQGHREKQADLQKSQAVRTLGPVFMNLPCHQSVPISYGNFIITVLCEHLGVFPKGVPFQYKKTSTKMKQKTLTKLEMNERMFINSLHVRNKFAKVNSQEIWTSKMELISVHLSIWLILKDLVLDVLLLSSWIPSLLSAK